MEQIVIYGAKSIALGVCEAVRSLYDGYEVLGFLVTSLVDNPVSLAGLPVMELASFAQGKSQEEKKKIHILIATPEDLHEVIKGSLLKYGFTKYTCMDSRKEAKLMEQYYRKKGQFALLHDLECGIETARIQVYQAKFYRDKVLGTKYDMPEWVESLQVGAELTDVRVSDLCDNVGIHISAKNVNYCELTGLYWLWKNELLTASSIEYVGLVHYRRLLVVTEEDLLRLKHNDIDVVLPYPTLHEPNITEHHGRYVKEEDWNAMLQALEELQPEYVKAYEEIFSQPYFYNYNMLIAKQQVLKDYCQWLFPILERTEELSDPKGIERADRYIGYLAENLMTLYFLYHQKELKIGHTGRLMLI